MHSALCGCGRAANALGASASACLAPASRSATFARRSLATQSAERQPICGSFAPAASGRRERWRAEPWRAELWRGRSSERALCAGCAAQERVRKRALLPLHPMRARLAAAALPARPRQAGLARQRQCQQTQRSRRRTASRCRHAPARTIVRPRRPISAAGANLPARPLAVGRANYRLANCVSPGDDTILMARGAGAKCAIGR